jgi:hypothetical protein
MTSCLREQLIIRFLTSLDSLSNQDWTGCPQWMILLNVNDTLHSKKSLCACSCHGLHDAVAAVPIDIYHLNDSLVKLCSFSAKISLGYQTLIYLQLQSKNETIFSNEIVVQLLCTEKHRDNLMPRHPTSSPETDTSSSSIVWSVDPEGWISSYLSLYHSLVRSAMRLNLPQGHHPRVSTSPPAFDFPVFVMNLPHRRDKRRSTEALLRALGFARAAFPDATPAAAVDPDALVARGLVRRAAVDAILARRDKGPRALRAYLANALDQVSPARPARCAPPAARRLMRAAGRAPPATRQLVPACTARTILCRPAPDGPIRAARTSAPHARPAPHCARPIFDRLGSLSIRRPRRNPAPCVGTHRPMHAPHKGRPRAAPAGPAPRRGPFCAIRTRPCARPPRREARTICGAVPDARDGGRSPSRTERGEIQAQVSGPGPRLARGGSAPGGAFAGRAGPAAGAGDPRGAVVGPGPGAERPRPA